MSDAKRLIRPSNAATWAKCSAYCTATRNAPRTADSETRIVGSALHEVARTELLNPERNIRELIGTTVVVDDEHEVILTAEMLTRVKMYIDYVAGVSRSGSTEGIEDPVSITSVHPDLSGTVDFWTFNYRNDMLTVADYKDGWVEISPVENYQLILYAIGIIDNHLVTPAKVNFVIVQPRSQRVNKIKEFTVSMDYIDTYRARLKKAAKAATEGPLKETPGLHCKRCEARPRCAGFNGAIENLFHAFVHSDDPGRDYDISARLRFLEYAASLINASLDVEKQKAEALIESGTAVNGYELKTGRTTWKFKEEAEKTEIQKACDMFGVNAGSFKFRTPTQIKNDGVPEEMLNVLTERIPGKRALKPVDLDEIKMIFGGE